MSDDPMGSLMSEHSPLGASGAHRWMNCAGSVALLRELELPESDESDYAAEGTAMHEAAAAALGEEIDAWELVGRTYHEIEMTPELVLPLQIYLDHCRSLMSTQTFGVEFKISSPVHPLFFGTADWWSIAPFEPTSTWYDVPEPPADWEHAGRNALFVTDLKGGIGLTVEANNNPQLKYYAFGVIDTLERQRSYVFDDNMPVVLTIVQPRGFHMDGPVRSWVTTVGEIKRWTHEVLVPAMLATAYDNSLLAGNWCRFCPAKLVCPVLSTLFRAAATASADAAAALTDEQVGYDYRFIDPVKFFVKALEKEAFRRLNDGKPLPWGDGKQLKLVHMKANRVWKDGAQSLALARFGVAALSDPLHKLLTNVGPELAPYVASPAQLEKLPGAADFVKQHAFTPKGALTVAPPDDSRPAIDVKRLSEVYAGAIDVQDPS